MEPQIHELRSELEALEAKTTKQPEPDTLSPHDKALQHLNGVMDRLWAKYHKSIEERNGASKTCPACYFRQPISNTVCERCSTEPVRWLEAVAAYPDHDGRGNGGTWFGTQQAVTDHNFRVWLANDAPLEQIKVYATQRWNSRPEILKLAQQTLKFLAKANGCQLTSGLRSGWPTTV